MTPHPNREAFGITANSDLAVEDQAADWLSRRDAGFTAAENKAFQRWLAADSRHVSAFDAVASAWRTVRRPARHGHAEAMIAELARRARLRWWRRMIASTAWLGLAAAAVVLAFLPRSLPTVRREASVDAAATFAVRAARQVLPDGSVVELNAGAEVIEEFSAEHRTVTLLRGIAHFSVRKDPSRPFVVVAGNVAVRAVGTEFAVNLAGQHVEVLVNEGSVAIEQGRTYDAAATVVAAAGARRRVTVPLAADAGSALEFAELSPEEVALALAWRRQRVEFSGTPLREAIGLFNQQNRLQLSLADENLGVLQVSGVFWLNQPEGFARLLELSFELRRVPSRDDSITLAR